MASMAAWDCARLEQIHAVAKDYRTSCTDDGRVLYYLDANGRYDCKDRLRLLLAHAERIGALDRIALLEEPFAPGDETDVSDLPVTINADESAHGVDDVKRRLAQGLPRPSPSSRLQRRSRSPSGWPPPCMRRARSASGADLTVNPFLAQWNKQFAARIAPLSKMNVGCLEVNGDQNYVTWDAQKALLPDGVRYDDEADGVFTLDERFYETSGRLFGENGYHAFFTKKSR